MAVIQPKYGVDFLSYRYPNQIEGNGLSDFNFFYTTINKTFLFKNKGEPSTTVTIDFLSVDNAFVVNNTLTNP